MLQWFGITLDRFLRSGFESCCTMLGKLQPPGLVRTCRCNVLGSVLNGLLSLRFQLVPDGHKSRIVFVESEMGGMMYVLMCL